MAAVRCFLRVAAFLCNAKKVFMANTTGMLLVTLLIYAAIIYGAVQLVKYFIRYGIDYYFKKLAESQKNKED